MPGVLGATPCSCDTLQGSWNKQRTIIFYLLYSVVEGCLRSDLVIAEMEL